MKTATIAGLAIVVVATILVHLAVPFPSDVAWLLSVNERLVDGSQLYSDILETNPPMAVWLYTVPVVLERVTGLAAENFVILETTGAALFSLWLSARVLDPTIPKLPAVVAVVIVLLLPIDSFAQREHFVLLGLLPWLALTMRRDTATRPPASAIVAAGIGLALALSIKPHFIIVVALVVLLTVWRCRSWRPLIAPEHWIAAALLAAYFLVIVVAYPAFLTDILPAASRIYVPLRMDTTSLLLQPHALIVYLGLLLAATLYRRAAMAGAMPLVLMAILGCLIVYLVQGKGWAYHLLPGTTLALLAIIAFGFQQPRHRIVPALVGLVGTTQAVLFGITALTQAEPLLALGSYGRNLSIELISGDIGLANPVHRQLGDRLVNSEPMLWRATGAIILGRTARTEDMSALASLEQADRRRLAADLARYAPDLILADTKGFDWLAWARADPSIAAALGHYSIDTVIQTHGTDVTVLHRVR